MKSTSILSSMCIMPLLAYASPAGRILARDTSSLTVAQLEAIAPTSNTCDNPPAAGECATAEQAVPHITKSFDTYGVTSRAEQAAVIALMAFESGDFKYNKNHFPGVPGQGSAYPALYPLPAMPDREVDVNDGIQHETCNLPPTTPNTRLLSPRSRTNSPAYPET